MPKSKPANTEDGITQRQEAFLVDLCDENPELALELDLHDDDAIADRSTNEAGALIDQFLKAREQWPRGKKKVKPCKCAERFANRGGAGTVKRTLNSRTLSSGKESTPPRESTTTARGNI
ncbi:MAG: hypothetical protein OXE85_05580 [Roseovarius sp.]|nr:hypothetical protein [Roseovarius sp.]